MALLALIKPKPKNENKEDQAKLKEAQKKSKRGMTAAGAAFLALGLIGLAIFGYMIFANGGLSALTGMASGIGLVISLVVLLAGIYMK
jgi:hypothetical protein